MPLCRVQLDITYAVCFQLLDYGEPGAEAEQADAAAEPADAAAEHQQDAEAADNGAAAAQETDQVSSLKADVTVDRAP